MDNNVYSIVSAFRYNGKKMLVVRMNGAACVMTEDEYIKIIIAERKYKQWKRKKVA